MLWVALFCFVVCVSIVGFLVFLFTFWGGILGFAFLF